jgi:hypothetical protein
LLKELDFEDLEKDKYKFRDIVTYSNVEKRNRMNERLLKANTLEIHRDEDFFNDFRKGFEPRFEYNNDDFQVSVMYRSET